MSVRRQLAMAASLLTLGLAGPALAEGGLAKLPLTQNGGTWKAGHVQGVAVDVKGGFIYYSFTTLLAKYDFSGRLIGTLVGWSAGRGTWATSTSIRPTARSTARWSTRKTRPSTSP